MRPFRRVKVTSPNGQLLSDGFGVYRYSEGYYYEVIEYGNGFNGCVPPVFNGTLAINVPLLAQKLYSALKQLSA